MTQAPVKLNKGAAKHILAWLLVTGLGILPAPVQARFCSSSSSGSACFPSRDSCEAAITKCQEARHNGWNGSCPRSNSCQEESGEGASSATPVQDLSGALGALLAPLQKQAVEQQRRRDLELQQKLKRSEAEALSAVQQSQESARQSSTSADDLRQQLNSLDEAGDETPYVPDRNCSQDWAACSEAMAQSEHMERRANSDLAWSAASAAGGVTGDELTAQLSKGVTNAGAETVKNFAQRDAFKESLAEDAAEAGSKAADYQEQSKACYADFKKSEKEREAGKGDLKDNAGRQNIYLEVLTKCLTAAGKEFVEGAIDAAGGAYSLSKKFYDTAKRFVPDFADRCFKQFEKMANNTQKCAETACH